MFTFNQNYFNYFFKTVVAVFFIIFSLYFLNNKFGGGDEAHFYENLQLVKNVGLYQAIAQKIGFTYILLAYPLSFLFNDFIALRLVNIILYLVLLFYFFKMGNLKNKLFIYYFLFYSCSGWFLMGTNDTLFIVSMVIFFNEVYKILEEKTQVSIPLLFCSLIIAFFTRQLVYIYFPVILLSVILILPKTKINLASLKIPILLFLALVIINIPSLIANKNFSYDNKIPPKHVQSNWAQRQYLAQLMVNSGEIKHETHPTWEQTDAYLQKNGINSLPNSTLSSILFDLELTFKEFFKNFGYLLFQSVRQTGLILITVFAFLCYQIFKKRISTNLLMPFCTLLMMLLFSLIIISFVEVRWLIPIYIMAIIYYSDLEYDKKLHRLIPIVNQLFLIIVMFYGVYKVSNKF